MSARVSATTTVGLAPGQTAAQAVRLPVAATAIAQVTVSGLMTQKGGVFGTKCYDAFYYNTCGGSWHGNGVVNSVWLVPPGWKSDPTSVVLLSSLAGSAYPAFSASHVYHLTLNLAGKTGWSLFAAATVRGGTLADWSGGFTLQFAGAASNPCGETASAAQAGATTPNPTCPPTVLPSPAGFGQTVSRKAPRPGGAAVIASPKVVAALKTLTARVSGIYPADRVMLAAARHQCFVNFTKGLVDTLNRATPDERVHIKEGFTASLIGAGLGTPTGNYRVFDTLATCLALVEAVERTFPAAATNASAAGSCLMSPVTLSLSGSGSSTRLTSFTVGGSTPLQATCVSSAGAIAISTASTTEPLRSLVGPRLGLAILRNRNDPPGGQLSVTFSAAGASPGSTTPNLTGSWVSPASPSSPPWILEASSDLRTLTGTWSGSGSHSALAGTFHTTLEGPTTYSGTFHITEGSNFADGSITFTIETPDRLSVTIQPTSCGVCSKARSTFTLTR